MPGIIKLWRKSRANVQTRNRRASKRVTTEVRKGLQRGGREFIRTLQRKHMTGRPGLNRRTGFLVRGWFSHVLNRNNLGRMKLVIWTVVPYAKYHTDTDLKAAHLPMRLPVQREWREMTREGGRFDELLLKALSELGNA